MSFLPSCEKLRIAEYDAGGGVEAEYVYAGDKLLAMPGNAANSGFEEGTAGWTLGTGASVVTHATNAHSGSNYLQLSTSTGSEALGGYVAVSPGETIVFGGWVYCQSGSSTYTSWDLVAYNSSYGVVSYQLPSPSTVTSATWTYQIGTYTVPSGVAYVQLYAQIYLPTGATVARFDDGFLSAGTLYYHRDHLSNRLITNSAGSDTAPNTGQQGHFPYGEQWYPALPSPPVTKWVFTGKERDSESGLDNFGARYNSSQYGRFMSPDPLGGKLADPQTLNKYSYVRNNPVTLTDPTGMYTCTDDPSDGSSHCASAQDQAFEKALNNLRNSSNADVARAAGAYGAVNTANGVTVGFANLNGSGENGQTLSTIGYANGQFQADSSVTINSNAKGADFDAAIGHEGSHVADAHDVVNSGLTEDGQKIYGGENITPYTSEQRAYGVTNSILSNENVSEHFNCGVSTCTLGKGVPPGQVPGTVDQIMRSNPAVYSVNGKPMSSTNQGVSVVNGVDGQRPAPNTTVPH
jgi:RHS repeat-associated protein